MAKDKKPIMFTIPGYQPIAENYLYHGTDHFLRVTRYTDPSPKMLVEHITEQAQLCVNNLSRLEEALDQEQSPKLSSFWLIYNLISNLELKPIIMAIARKDDALISDLLTDVSAGYPGSGLDYLALNVYTTVNPEIQEAVVNAESYGLFDELELGINLFNLNLRLTNGQLPPEDLVYTLLKNKVRISDTLDAAYPDQDYAGQPAMEDIVASLYSKRYQAKEFAILHSTSETRLANVADRVFEEFIDRYLFTMKVIPESANDSVESEINWQEYCNSLDQKSALSFVIHGKKNGHS